MTNRRSAKKARKREKSILNRLTPTKTVSAKSTSIETPDTILGRATAFLQESQPEEALGLALCALSLIEKSTPNSKAILPALNLVAQIHLELGDIASARNYFLRAVEIDKEGLLPEDAGGGAEKFLWLAQLCEEGGTVSIEWYEKGVYALRCQITEMENKSSEESITHVKEKKTKIANALCGAVEVYMTDLSWEEDAESRCESLVTEALLVAPNAPEVLQTLASVRISQSRIEDAKSALAASMESWKDLPPEDTKVPAFPTRISLARLLLETEMEEEALEVIERLVAEDDQSIEGWYLGGWSLYIMGEKKRHGGDDVEWKQLWRLSREWLSNGLQLYHSLEYEDERLKDHALELVGNLSKEVGEEAPEVSDEKEEDDSEWEDDSDDDEMDGMEGNLAV